MPSSCVTGIVTGYTDYKDNDRILTLFTLEQGRVDVKARGCRKTTAPLLACAQPFVYGEYELFTTKGKYSVRQCDIRDSYYPLREDIDRYAVASMVTRTCQETVQENEKNAPLFELLTYTLTFLAYADTAPADILYAFLLRYLSKTGYTPAITTCCMCGRDVRSDAKLFFSSARGGTLCLACSKGEQPVSKLALEAMRRILLLDDAEMDRVVLTPALRKELSAALLPYAEQILGSESKAMQLFLRMTK